jgi:hypothetical protein
MPALSSPSALRVDANERTDRTQPRCAFKFQYIRAQELSRPKRERRVVDHCLNRVERPSDRNNLIECQRWPPPLSSEEAA